MTDAIAVLETLACTPGRVAADRLATLACPLPAAQREALIAHDGRALAAMLGGRADMACTIMLPDNDQPLREVPDEETPDEQDTPAYEPDADAA